MNMLRGATRRIICLSPSAGRNPFTLQTRQKHYTNATAKDFADRINDKSNKNLLLVDFFATWCRPCDMLSPVLEAAVENSKTKFGKELDLMTVDTDQEGELAAQYRVTALPTVIAFKNGEPISAFQGAIPQSKVEEFIENLFKV